MFHLEVLMKAPAFGRPESQVAQREVEVVDGFLVESSLVAFERNDLLPQAGCKGSKVVLHVISCAGIFGGLKASKASGSQPR